MDLKTVKSGISSKSDVPLANVKSSGIIRVGLGNGVVTMARIKPMNIALDLLTQNGSMTPNEMAKKWPGERSGPEMAHYLYDLSLQGKVQPVGGLGSITSIDVDQKYILTQ